jgi:hypothetical protein
MAYVLTVFAPEPQFGKKGAETTEALTANGNGQRLIVCVMVVCEVREVIA